MPVDFTQELKHALKDPEVGAAIAQHLKPIVIQALAEREHDGLLSPKQAACFLYGRDGADGAFRKMRERNPEIDAISIGEGKRRRWRRSELAEVWGRLNPGSLKS